MDKISRMSAEHRGNLVAYLDGELSEKAAQEVEQILASSPVARNEVEMLARTWDMLGMMPTQRASGMFSQHTMEKLKVVDQKPVPVSERAWFRPVRRSVLFAVWSLALAGAFLVGFNLTLRWIPNPTNDLVDRLPVIQNLEAYRSLGSIEFLRTVQRDEEVLRLLQERADHVRRETSVTGSGSSGDPHAP